MYFCGEKKIRSMTSLAEEKMSIIFGPQRIQTRGIRKVMITMTCLATASRWAFQIHTAAPYVCGTSHAIANAVRYHIPDPSCDKDAREHSRHMVMALASDCSLHRVAKHGILIFFLPRYLPSLSLIGVA